MKLIVGLGNPEARYDGTRHNSGYHVLDSYAREHSALFASRSRFKADLAEITDRDEKVILIKPTTYYNLSGEAVRAVADFYHIEPSDVLIVHDEMMLPFGTIRTRQGGGDAGNNGLKSITSHLGPDTYRLRIGIENDLRSQMDDADFVLGKFTSEEQTRLNEIIPKICEIIDYFISGTCPITTHR